MRIIATIIFWYLSLGIAKSQFYFGYQAAKYIPGLNNIRNTTYLYNQIYQAKFHYLDIGHGVIVGARTPDKTFLDFAWHNKHFVATSDYTFNGVVNRMKIKTRLNTLYVGGGFTAKDWTFGGAFDMANFKIFTRRSERSVFSNAKWTTELYGSPIKLPFLPTMPGISAYIEKKADKMAIRFFYQTGIGDETFANDGTRSFYDFKPSNLGIALIIFTKK